MIRKTAIIVGTSILACTAMSGMFEAICVVMGHNDVEARWGGWATVVLTVGVGVETALTLNS